MKTTLKTLLVSAAIILPVAAFAAEQKPANTQGGMMQGNMMQGDMMKNCQEHMKDGKMMDNMPKDMMQKCQEMMKDGGMMGGGMQGQEGMKADTKEKTPAGVSEEDHKKHHPAK